MSTSFESDFSALAQIVAKRQRLAAGRIDLAERRVDLGNPLDETVDFIDARAHARIGIAARKRQPIHHVVERGGELAALQDRLLPLDSRRRIRRQPSERVEQIVHRPVDRFSRLANCRLDDREHAGNGRLTLLGWPLLLEPLFEPHVACGMQSFDLDAAAGTPAIHAGHRGQQRLPARVARSIDVGNVLARDVEPEPLRIECARRHLQAVEQTRHQTLASIDPPRVGAAGNFSAPCREYA